jgi:hypothetical protein
LGECRINSRFASRALTTCAALSIALTRRIKPIDISGLVVTFEPNKNEGLDQVFLTIINPDRSFDVVDKLSM